MPVPVGIRELKRRYKINLALGRALPTHDLGIPLPLSTGAPLSDGALVDKLVATATLNEPEHLRRAWLLVRAGDEREHALLQRHARALLNDYKLLLALYAWERGHEERCRAFLRALPWGWRLRFPIAVIKPAAVIFTGWRRALSFRLVEDPRYPALRALYLELLASAPGVAILKYRAAIKQSAALLRLRFTSPRERAIHSLCFEKGRTRVRCDFEAIEPVATYLRAREALVAESSARPSKGALQAFLRALAGRHPIPITSYMGMLGARGVKLTDPRQPELEPLRDYALRCATPVESLLRISEWSPWLTDARAEQLAIKVKRGILERGLSLPFFKVTKAFMAAPLGARRRLLRPLFKPLLLHFGRRLGGLLGDAGPVSFVQPANVIHVMSFLLYATVASAAPTRLLLLRDRGVDVIDDLELDGVIDHLADDRDQLERWLLSEFGGLSTRGAHSYDFPAVARSIRQLNPDAPLILDIPFADNMDILGALLPFQRVFNLNDAYGAPGELCIAYEYYQRFGLYLGRDTFTIWGRYSDAAATRFAELLERLQHFQALAAETPAPTSARALGGPA